MGALITTCQRAAVHPILSHPTHLYRFLLPHPHLTLYPLYQPCFFTCFLTISTSFQLKTAYRDRPCSMATLTRTRPSLETHSYSEDETEDIIRRRLQLEIPKPFPNRHELEQEEELEALANENLVLDTQLPTTAHVGIVYPTSEDRSGEKETSSSQPSIQRIETSNATIENKHADVNPHFLPPSLAMTQRHAYTCRM